MLEEESTDIKMIGGQTTVKVSSSKLKELSILKSIVSSTVMNEKNEQYTFDSVGIGNLPQEIGLQLFEAVSEINTIDSKKND
jgi:hypothetical protein